MLHNVLRLADSRLQSLIAIWCPRSILRYFSVHRLPSLLRPLTVVSNGEQRRQLVPLGRKRLTVHSISRGNIRQMNAIIVCGRCITIIVRQEHFPVDTQRRNSLIIGCCGKRSVVDDNAVKTSIQIQRGLFPISHSRACHSQWAVHHYARPRAVCRTVGRSDVTRQLVYTIFYILRIRHHNLYPIVPFPVSLVKLHKATRTEMLLHHTAVDLHSKARSRPTGNTQLHSKRSLTTHHLYR